jgi:DNA-binding transcriptional MocR family regulator
MAVAAYLGTGSYDRHLRRLRGTYRGLMTRVAAAVGEHFPAGTMLTRPRGGHVLWVEMPAKVDALELLRRARRHGVTFAPGPLFSACGDYRSSLRLNCAVPWSEAVEGALATLGRLADELASEPN